MKGSTLLCKKIRSQTKQHKVAADRLFAVISNHISVVPESSHSIVVFKPEVEPRTSRISAFAEILRRFRILINAPPISGLVQIKMPALPEASSLPHEVTPHTNMPTPHVATSPSSRHLQTGLILWIRAIKFRNRTHIAV